MHTHTRTTLTREHTKVTLFLISNRFSAILIMIRGTHMLFFYFSFLNVFFSFINSFFLSFFFFLKNRNYIALLFILWNLKLTFSFILCFRFERKRKPQSYSYFNENVDKIHMDVGRACALCKRGRNAVNDAGRPHGTKCRRQEYVRRDTRLGLVRPRRDRQAAKGRGCRQGAREQ